MIREGLVSQRLSERLELPIVVSVPHAGLVVPEERRELMMLPQNIFLRDVDFEIHQMWQSACAALDITFIKAESHRYAIDLNRQSDQVDAATVRDHSRPAGTVTRGLFWTKSTQNEGLGRGGQDFRPLDPEVAAALVANVWSPYHAALSAALERVRARHGFAMLIDGHSMPSLGTKFHADPLSERPDIVPGNFHGHSELVGLTKQCVQTATSAGFSVKVNDPYAGGGITQRFGQPDRSLHALQIEVKRSLYMNEDSKALILPGLQRLQAFALTFLSRVGELSPS